MIISTITLMMTIILLFFNDLVYTRDMFSMYAISILLSLLYSLIFSTSAL